MKYLKFREKTSTDKEMTVINHKGDFLGDICYENVGRKKQWVFYPEEGTWWTIECINQLNEFIKQLKDK